MKKNDAEKLLLELASIPTAAGHEDAVIAYIERWAAARPGLELRRDGCGNLHISRKDFRAACRKRAPLFITAHLDHPAFVVRGVKGRRLELEFRGGVHDKYFKGAAIEVFTPDLARSFPARVVSLDPKAKPYKRASALLARPAEGVKAGCIARWKFPAAAIKKGLAHLPACDDLACAAAALTAYEAISKDKKLAHAALLFTRAEEVGFIGALGAARSGAIPKNARLVCLECSRSFPHDSPIGGGPIVRVGDKRSVFSPELTNALSDLAADYQKKKPAFRYQRKLMAGGSCEATGFSAYGFKSSCLCLPLGNYHNMADIDAVLAGKKKGRAAPEQISVADFHGLVELLLAAARGLDAPRPTLKAALEKTWAGGRAVLRA